MHVELIYKQYYILVDIILFHYIWFIDSEDLCLFHSYFEKKNSKVLTLNIVHLPKLWIKRLPLISAAPKSFKI